jgi:hypothetical protein
MPEVSRTQPLSSVAVSCVGTWRTETLRIQQVTEADCLMRARDFKHAELAKNQPPLYLQVSDWMIILKGKKINNNDMC